MAGRSQAGKAANFLRQLRDGRQAAHDKGGEMLSIGKAALKARQKALEANQRQQGQLQDSRTIPEMEQVGGTVSTRLIDKQTSPWIFRTMARRVGVSMSYFDSDFADDMADQINTFWREPCDRGG